MHAASCRSSTEIVLWTNQIAVVGNLEVQDDVTEYRDRDPARLAPESQEVLQARDLHNWQSRYQSVIYLSIKVSSRCEPFPLLDEQ